MPSGFQAFGSAEGYVGSGSVKPDGIPGLILWTTSDTGITDSGSPLAVDSWADQSTHGNNLTMTGANRPIFVASDANLGGAPSLNCAVGTGPFAHKGLKASALAYGAFTIFTVQTGISGADGYFYYRTQDANNTDFCYSATVSISSKRASVSDDRNVNATWGHWGATTFKTLCARFGGTNATNILRLNGVDQAMVDSANHDPGTGSITADFYLGTDNSVGTSAGAKYGAVLIYSRLLSDGEIGAVELYLKNKYNHY